jgi:hypothetical protein
MSLFAILIPPDNSPGDSPGGWILVLGLDGLSGFLESKLFPVLLTRL